MGGGMTHLPCCLPLPQYKPHNQTQHSDKLHKPAHLPHPHPHKAGKPHQQHGSGGSKGAANGVPASKAASGKPQQVHVHTDAAATAANGAPTPAEPVAAASS